MAIEEWRWYGRRNGGGWKRGGGRVVEGVSAESRKSGRRRGFVIRTYIVQM